MYATKVNAGRLLAVPALIMVFSLAGCGGTGEISGTVRLGGKALSTGRVTFVNATDPSVVAYSAILKDGSYKVTDCPSGSFKIAVQTVVPRSSRGHAGMKPGSGASLKIPVRYIDPSTSGLETTVGRGQQQYDIELIP
jgi:hypothetical protein